MSRSYKKNTIMKKDRHSSDKKDKEIANKTFRRKYNTASTMKSVDEDDSPVVSGKDRHQFGNCNRWSFTSDGMRWFFGKGSRSQLTDKEREYYSRK